MVDSSEIQRVGWESIVGQSKVKRWLEDKRACEQSTIQGSPEDRAVALQIFVRTWQPSDALARCVALIESVSEPHQVRMAAMSLMNYLGVNKKKETRTLNTLELLVELVGNEDEHIGIRRSGFSTLVRLFGDSFEEFDSEEIGFMTFNLDDERIPKTISKIRQRFLERT